MAATASRAGAALAQAAAALAAGDPGAARAAARRALKRDPHSAAALRSLAEAELLAGGAGPALEAARRAVALAPADAEAQFVLGLAHQSNGEAEAAAAAYREAIARDPAHVKALTNLGNHFVARDELDAAEPHLRAAAQARPDLARTQNNLGRLLNRLGRWAEAETVLRRALALRPGYVEAHYNLGLALHRTERFAEAAAQFRAALAQRPDLTEAREQLGQCLLALRRPAEALEQLLAAAQAAPDSPTLAHDIGVAYVELDRYDEAETWLQRAVAGAADAPGTWVVLGNNRLRRHGPAAALPCYEQALAVRTDDANAHFHAALARLSLGDFERGWRDYEWRWGTPALMKSAPAYAQPLWLGDLPVQGRTILLHAEQGFGDTLQFSRFVPRVAALGARVLLQVPTELSRLFKGFPGVAELVAEGAPLPPFDLHCPLMSLPLALGTRPDTIPPPVAFARPEMPPGAETGPVRVGVAWAGNPSHADDRRRSVPLAAFARLFDIEHVAFHVLQKQHRAGDALILDASPTVHVAVRDAHDFADTAAMTAGLDLVIAVDSSIAHLAGTLGRPVWVLLAHTCDWRWDSGRPDTPWYPTARLFRQRRVGDWASVLDEMAEALRGLVAARRGTVA